MVFSSSVLRAEETLLFSAADLAARFSMSVTASAPYSAVKRADFFAEISAAKSNFRFQMAAAGRMGSGLFPVYSVRNGIYFDPVY